MLFRSSSFCTRAGLAVVAATALMSLAACSTSVDVDTGSEHTPTPSTSSPIPATTPPATPTITPTATGKPTVKPRATPGTPDGSGDRDGAGGTNDHGGGGAGGGGSQRDGDGRSRVPGDSRNDRGTDGGLVEAQPIPPAGQPDVSLPEPGYSRGGNGGSSGGGSGSVTTPNRPSNPGPGGSDGSPSNPGGSGDTPGAPSNPGTPGTPGGSDDTPGAPGNPSDPGTPGGSDDTPGTPSNPGEPAPTEQPPKPTTPESKPSLPGLSKNDVTRNEMASFIGQYNKIRAEQGLPPLPASRFRVGTGPFSELSQRHLDAATAGKPLPPHEGMVATNEVQIAGEIPHYFAFPGSTLANEWWNSKAHRALLFHPDDPNYFTDNDKCIVLNITRNSYGEGGWDSHADARAAVINCDGAYSTNTVASTLADPALKEYRAPAPVAGARYNPNATYPGGFPLLPDQWKQYQDGKPYTARR